jgi:hypothetical protein
MPENPCSSYPVIIIRYGFKRLYSAAAAHLTQKDRNAFKLIEEAYWMLGIVTLLMAK